MASINTDFSTNIIIEINNIHAYVDEKAYKLALYAQKKLQNFSSSTPAQQQSILSKISKKILEINEYITEQLAKIEQKIKTYLGSLYQSVLDQMAILEPLATAPSANLSSLTDWATSVADYFKSKITEYAIMLQELTVMATTLFTTVASFATHNHFSSVSLVFNSYGIPFSPPATPTMTLTPTIPPITDVPLPETTITSSPFIPPPIVPLSTTSSKPSIV